MRGGFPDFLETFQSGGELMCGIVCDAIDESLGEVGKELGLS